MTGFIEGESRAQATLFPERWDGYIAEDSPARVFDIFADDLDLESLRFKKVPDGTQTGEYRDEFACTGL